jgi:hypothetical protein
LEEDSIKEQIFGRRNEGIFSLEKARAMPYCEKNLPLEIKRYFFRGDHF